MFVLGPLVLRALGGRLRRFLLGLVYLVETRLVLCSCNRQCFIYIHMKAYKKREEEKSAELPTRNRIVVSFFIFFHCCHRLQHDTLQYFNCKSVFCYQLKNVTVKLLTGFSGPNYVWLRSQNNTLYTILGYTNSRDLAESSLNKRKQSSLLCS